MRVLSIDAWREFDGSWQWNAWYNVGALPKEKADILDSSRKLLRWFRDEGFLTEESKGKIAIIDDQYNVVIVKRGTMEPLFAVEYGATEN